MSAAARGRPRPAAADRENEVAYWYGRAPHVVDDWDVNPVGCRANDGAGIIIGGHETALQIDCQNERGKKRGDEAIASGTDKYHMVANATQMVHIAPVRFLRPQMVRGVFEASFSQLSVEAAASMRALVRASASSTILKCPA